MYKSWVIFANNHCQYLQKLTIENNNNGIYLKSIFPYVKESLEEGLAELKQLVKEKDIRYPLDTKCDQPERVASIIEDVFDLSNSPEEKLVMLTLDTKLKITGIFIVSIGTINENIVHPREVYKRAMLQNAHCIVIAHNHPSGDTTPSEEDLAITERLKEAGELLGIRLLDHLILGNGYRSLKEQGII